MSSPNTSGKQRFEAYLYPGCIEAIKWKAFQAGQTIEHIDAVVNYFFDQVRNDPAFQFLHSMDASYTRLNIDHMTWNELIGGPFPFLHTGLENYPRVLQQSKQDDATNDKNLLPQPSESDHNLHHNHSFPQSSNPVPSNQVQALHDNLLPQTSQYIQVLHHNLPMNTNTLATSEENARSANTPAKKKIKLVLSSSATRNRDATSTAATDTDMTTSHPIVKPDYDTLQSVLRPPLNPSYSSQPQTSGEHNPNMSATADSRMSNPLSAPRYVAESNRNSSPMPFDSLPTAPFLPLVRASMTPASNVDPNMVSQPPTMSSNLSMTAGGASPVFGGPRSDPYKSLYTPTKKRKVDEQ